MKNSQVDKIQSLWIGDSLSPMQIASINSFKANGHDLDIYVYNDVNNMPSHVNIIDANDIIHNPDIEAWKNSTQKLAGLSNWFRYELLNKIGGCWFDLDFICIKQITLDPDGEIGTERRRNGDIEPNNTPIRVPVGHSLISEACKHARETQLTIDKPKILGPRWMRKNIGYHNIKRSHVDKYSPVDFFDLRSFLNPNKKDSICKDNTEAVHLWSSAWGPKVVKYKLNPPKGSFYWQVLEDYT